MFRVRYCHPINHSVATRYFKSLDTIKRFISDYNCNISFSICTDFGEDLYFSYDVKEDCFYGSFSNLECDARSDDFETI